MAKVTMDISSRILEELETHVEVFDYDNRSALIRTVLRDWLRDNRSELIEEAERVGIDLEETD